MGGGGSLGGGGAASTPAMNTAAITARAVIIEWSLIVIVDQRETADVEGAFLMEKNVVDLASKEKRKEHRGNEGKRPF
jgi:hypothetical protein